MRVNTNNQLKHATNIRNALELNIKSINKKVGNYNDIHNRLLQFHPNSGHKVNKHNDALFINGYDALPRLIIKINL